MNLLLINPNTSPEITDKVVLAARAVARPGTTVAGATGRFGARYITTRSAAAIAAHSTLDAYARHGDTADVIVLACFGDPGLAALKELATQPVVGMAEASCMLAASRGARFSIVTGGTRWGLMLEEFVLSIGLSSRLASVRTVAPTGAAIAADPESALALLAAQCVAAVEEDGAEAVILGGAGLAGLASRIAHRVPVPLIDSVHAVVSAAEALGGLALQKAVAGTHAMPEPVATLGLAPELASRLEGHPAPGAGGSRMETGG